MTNKRAQAGGPGAETFDPAGRAQATENQLAIGVPLELNKNFHSSLYELACE